MYYLVALISVLLVTVLDGRLSTGVLSFVAFCICVIGTRIGTVSRSKGGIIKVFGLVFPIYIIIAYISSLSFMNGHHFYVIDAANDLDNFNVGSWSPTYFWEEIRRCYFEFADNNALYNRCMEWLGYWANTTLDGTTPFFFTLPITLFGVLSAMTFYQILSDRYEEIDATKYAITFALFSFFLLYSCLIIRDIIIAYFYLVGFRIILRKPRYKDIFVLVLCFIIIWGVRLYSGLFFGVFLAFWFYKIINRKNGIGKALLLPIAVIAIAFAASSIVATTLFSQTSDELTSYVEMSTQGGSSNLSNKLYELPLGISHVALVAFAQTRIDPFDYLKIADSFSNYCISFLYCVPSFFWFVIFWGLMYYLFVKKEFFNLELDDKLLLVISFLFLAANTSHIDIRRMIYVFPYLYLLYLNVSKQYSMKYRRKINWSLFLSLLSIAIVYLAFRS